MCEACTAVICGEIERGLRGHEIDRLKNRKLPERGGLGKFYGSCACSNSTKKKNYFTK